jgi:rare lipoprotein A
MKRNIGKSMQNQIKEIMRNRIIVLISVFLLISVSELNAQQTYKKVGLASFYADKFEGRQTANGEIYYHAKKTAAHRTLPFGSIVKVINTENNKYAVVRINDRGPFVDNRIIDLSKSIAQELDFVKKGIVKVKIELIASTDDLPDKKSSTIKENNNSEYYEVNADIVFPTGKGIQIGSYKNDENVFRLVNRLKKKYNEQVFVEIATINNQKAYRIIVGNYSSESILNKLKKKLAKEFPDCFVVTFKK